jgi:hypothetical protein
MAGPGGLRMKLMLGSRADEDHMLHLEPKEAK